MALSLRTAVPDDLDEVMRLERAGFEPGIVEEPGVFARRLSAFPEGFLIGSEGDQSTPLGYLCAEIWEGWSSQETERFHLNHDIGQWLRPDGDTLYLASMTVAPEARGRGRGEELFAAGLRWFAQRFPVLQRAVLIVNEHWVGARRIYERHGFVETGRLPAFFQPTSGVVGAALIMQSSTLRSSL